MPTLELKLVKGPGEEQKNPFSKMFKENEKPDGDYKYLVESGDFISQITDVSKYFRNTPDNFAGKTESVVTNIRRSFTAAFRSYRSLTSNVEILKKSSNDLKEMISDLNKSK